MKIKKFVLSICVIIFSCISFFACSNINYTATIAEDGKINNKLIVSIYKNKAGDAFEDAKTLSTNLLTNFANNFNENIKEFNLLSNEMTITAEAKLTPTDIANNYTLSLIISAKDGLNYRQAIAAAATTNQTDLVKNVTDATNEYNAERKENEDKELDIEKGWFFKRYILTKTDNIFSGSKTLIDSLANQFRLNEKLSSFNIENDATFSQTYLFSEKKIKSTADRITLNIDTMQYAHTYNFSYSEIETKQIEIYQEVPNTVGWYVLALGITAVVMVLYFIISDYKKKETK